MSNDWESWRNYVLKELEKQSTSLEATAREMNSINLGFTAFKAEMKIRSSVWGVVGGLLAATAAILLKFIV